MFPKEIIKENAPSQTTLRVRLFFICIILSNYARTNVIIIGLKLVASQNLLFLRYHLKPLLRGISQSAPWRGSSRAFFSTRATTPSVRMPGRRNIVSAVNQPDVGCRCQALAVRQRSTGLAAINRRSYSD